MMIAMVSVTLIGVSGIVVAQRAARGRGPGVAPNLRATGGISLLQLPSNRNGTPTWDIDSQFKSDLFTFVRVRYSASGGRNFSWETDFPDSDLNFPFRLQQMTSMKVDPDPISLDLADERLMGYPFIYMLEVGGIDLSDPEVENLRHYLLNGGFLMVDDHWGSAYEVFRRQMKRVLPEFDPVELPLEHPIFHNVFNLKEKPQVPGINWATSHRGTKDTSENYSGPANYRGIFDSKGRMMVIICTNTDLGDGWEREGEQEWYFHEFSEKLAYPMGINIIVYAMTH